MARFQPDPRDVALDELLNQIRASHGLRPRDAEDRRAFASGWKAALEDASDYVESERERVSQQASRSFALTSPALVRWRDRILKHPRRAKPADVAAAYECLALECLLAGQPELAERARANARRAMGVRVMKSPENDDTRETLSA